MRTIMNGVLTAALLVGTSLTAAAPAQARYHHGGNGSGALIAGIIGLGVGAAIASDRHDYRGSGNYYGSGYAPAYYAEQPVVYYGGDYGYGYSQPYYGSGYDRGYYRGDRDHWDHRGGRDYDRHDRDGRDRGGRDRDRGDNGWGRDGRR